MKSSNIGGQAVLEGIMMRNGGRYCCSQETGRGYRSGYPAVQKYHSMEDTSEDPFYQRHF